MTPAVLDMMDRLLLDLDLPTASIRFLGPGAMDSGCVGGCVVVVSMSAGCSAVVGMCHIGTEVDLLCRLLMVVELGCHWSTDYSSV